MNASLRGALVVAALCALLAAAALVYWFGWRGHAAPVPVPAPEAPVAAPAAPAPAPGAGQPPPDLAGSDDEMARLIDTLLGTGAQTYFLRPGIVRRIVATVDALPRGRVPLKAMPVGPVPGSFRTAGAGPALAIGPDNAPRYARYVGWLTQVDTPQLVAAYRRDYPLFQQAYRELGYPNAEFNDRLVEALDDLLEAPAPPDPVLLTAPRAMFEYADPALQDASAGQKILMRMGRENQERVMSKLRELRRALDGVELPR